nr:hypothetical protein CFP56_57952 [Quercus suber]
MVVMAAPDLEIPPACPLHDSLLPPNDRIPPPSCFLQKAVQNVYILLPARSPTPSSSSDSPIPYVHSSCHRSIFSHLSTNTTTGIGRDSGAGKGI